MFGVLFRGSGTKSNWCRAGLATTQSALEQFDFFRFRGSQGSRDHNALIEMNSIQGYGLSGGRIGCEVSSSDLLLRHKVSKKERQDGVRYSTCNDSSTFANSTSFSVPPTAAHMRLKDSGVSSKRSCAVKGVPNKMNSVVCRMI